MLVYLAECLDHLRSQYSCRKFLLQLNAQGAFPRFAVESDRTFTLLCTLQALSVQAFVSYINLRTGLHRSKTAAPS
jgi:hypothetical protein